MQQIQIPLSSESGEASILLKNLAKAGRTTVKDFILRAGYSTYTYNQETIIIFYFNHSKVSLIEDGRPITLDKFTEIATVLGIDPHDDNILLDCVELCKHRHHMVERESGYLKPKLKSLYTAIHLSDKCLGIYSLQDKEYLLKFKK